MAYCTVDRLLAALPLEADDQATREALGTLAEGVTGEIDALLNFSFGDGEAVEATIDGSSTDKLYLPAPGAVFPVLSVSENGAVLSPTFYELEPRYGRYLLRLDGSNRVSWWTSYQRGVVVTFVPNPPPPAVQNICFDETLRRWHAKPGGSGDVAGVQGQNARRVPRAFTDHTLTVIASLRTDYGVRNLVAI